MSKERFKPGELPKYLRCYTSLNRKLVLTPVQPSGTDKAPAFVDGPGVHGLRMVEFPVYPPHPEGKALHDARVAAHVSFGDMARELGIRAVEYCELERGAATTDEAGWAECRAALDRLKGAAT